MAMKMTNATAVYIIMMVVLAAGLWTILSFGETLRAAPDLAGDWQMTESATGNVIIASINQSGRFIQLRWSGQPPWEMEMVPSQSSSAMRTVELKSRDAHFTVTETREPDVYSIVVVGRGGNKTYIGRLVMRTYPRSGAQRSTTIPD